MANKKQIGEAKLEMLRKDARALLQQMEHLEGGLISDINRSGKESLRRYYKEDDSARTLLRGIIPQMQEVVHSLEDRTVDFGQ